MTLSDPSAVWFGIDETAPGPGMVLVLNYHHDGESHWCSPEQAVVRIESILDGSKPEEEWGPRMEAMRIVPFGKWWMSETGSEAWAVCVKAGSEAEAVYDKAYSEAWAVYDKARFEARAVSVKAYSEAGAVYDKAYSEARAVSDKACSEAGAVYVKARSEAGAVYDKARFEARAVSAKARSEAEAIEYPAEAWAAEWKETRKPKTEGQLLLERILAAHPPVPPPKTLCAGCQVILARDGIVLGSQCPTGEDRW